MDKTEKFLVILVCLDLAVLSYFLTMHKDFSIYERAIQSIFGFFGIYLQSINSSELVNFLPIPNLFFINVFVCNKPLSHFDTQVFDAATQ